MSSTTTTAPVHRVLITGLNGFITPHIAHIFLSNGWIVRGTVRSESKKERVLSLPLFKPFVEDGKLEIAIVEDFVSSDWSEALQGVTGVVHAASASVFDQQLSADDFIKPAVDGTTRLVQAAAKVGTIKAFAYVSSIVAVLNILLPHTSHGAKTYTEGDWVSFIEEDARKEGAMSHQWYIISKKLAELAAYDAHESSNAKFALSSYCPPAVYGPPEHIASADELAKIVGTDMSVTQLAKLLTDGEDGVLIPEFNVVYVDVRDLALAIFKGINLQAKGRYLIVGETITSQKTVNTARRIRPDLATYIVKGQPDVGAEVAEGVYKVDASKSERELGIKYRTLEDTVRDTISKFEELGVYQK
ncbi:hypothetical protein I317_00730 [Kwoniella heveanensis CBS 569]|nr:hypothetical protein I317_00730 [Kwoniella heveanensis CBS 569]